MTELGSTTAPARWAGRAFVLGLVAVPLIQVVWEMSGDRQSSIAEFIPACLRGRPAEFEESLLRRSWIREEVVPWYQAAWTAWVGHGNEKALEARDGWLYYADDVALVTGPGYFDEGGAGERALDVAVGFRDSLASRGVELLLVPVPVKGMIDATALQWSKTESAPRNRHHERFSRECERRGLEVLDLFGWMQARVPEGPQYLARDTHWTPQTMESVAAEIARRVRTMVPLPAQPTGSELRPRRTDAPGDLVRMLRLPFRPGRYPEMPLELQCVVDASGNPWQPDRSAEVVLLGDSFTGVFSDPDLGMGEGAGLAEHLSHALRQPIDVIMQPAGAATSVRATFARRAGALEGRKLVVWQFALRELGSEPDRWRAVEFSQQPPPAAPAGQARVRAEIVEVSRVPEDFEYETCFATFEYRVEEALSGPIAPGTRVWVLHRAVEEFLPIEAARYQVGDRHLLSLDPIADHLDLNEESWVDDTLVEGPIWWPVSVER